jgi:hypothetical protein
VRKLASRLLSSVRSLPEAPGSSAAIPSRAMRIASTFAVASRWARNAAHPAGSRLTNACISTGTPSTSS